MDQLRRIKCHLPRWWSMIDYYRRWRSKMTMRPCSRQLIHRQWRSAIERRRRWTATKRLLRRMACSRCSSVRWNISQDLPSLIRGLGLRNRTQGMICQESLIWANVMRISRDPPIWFLSCRKESAPKSSMKTTENSECMLMNQKSTCTQLKTKMSSNTKDTAKEKPERRHGSTIKWANQINCMYRSSNRRRESKSNQTCRVSNHLASSGKCSNRTRIERMKKSTWRPSKIYRVRLKSCKT